MRSGIERDVGSAQTRAAHWADQRPSPCSTLRVSFLRVHTETHRRRRRRAARDIIRHTLLLPMCASE